MTSASTVHSLGNRVPFSQPRNFAFRDNPRLPRLRRDLHIRKHTYRGRVSYVIKDPVSLRYYRLGPLEYFIASHLDGLTTENDLLLLIDESFGKGTLTRAELRNILNSFLMMSLLELDSDRALSLANNLNQRQRDLLRKTSLLRHLGKITSFKISLLDPDIILLRLSKATSFLWTKSAIIILFVLLLTAILTLILNWDEAIAKTPDFFSLQNLIYLWIVSIFVKICHEFGHGLSCKHYGGEVHDMGFMCIVFTPYLFCDATDSWTFPNKWHRFFVTLAGIYVELFLASFAAILWVITEPGLLNQLSFNVMIVCSVSTIL
ncbi:MAG: hypothetical protein NZL93_01430, partial [Chthoniobacterales bacterium]|nr:hypothetical protein [Chthoniobacterales bacterium]